MYPPASPPPSSSGDRSFPSDQCGEAAAILPAEETRLAVLTPSGRGAVATVALVGPRAASVADGYFRPSGQQRLSQVPIGRIIFGRWGEPPGEEVVACRLSDQRVEIHGHGGLAASAQIVQALVAAGCQSVPWQQLLPPGDAIRIEAAEALAQCRTRRTATILLEQYQGALAGAVGKMIEQLQNRQTPAARQQLLALLQWSPLGLRLVKPFRVVLAGRPNVGKSSLLNRLLGYARSIVTDTPGTTRDVVTQAAAFGGWPVTLTDTAGLRRHTLDALETAGMLLTEAEAAQADLLILVNEASGGEPEEYRRLAERFPQALAVTNKSDLLSPDAERNLPSVQGMAVSAKTGQGISQLAEAIAARLVPCEPAPGEAVPFTARQVECLQAAAAALPNDVIRAAEHLQRLLSSRLSLRESKSFRAAKGDTQVGP